MFVYWTAHKIAIEQGDAEPYAKLAALSPYGVEVFFCMLALLVILLGAAWMRAYVSRMSDTPEVRDLKVIRTVFFPTDQTKLVDWAFCTFFSLCGGAVYSMMVSKMVILSVYVMGFLARSSPLGQEIIFFSTLGILVCAPFVFDRFFPRPKADK
ncbi:MAG: hypothetical protein NT003_00505 [Candidatus Magasanikbacteria bacterium]|nr:hypothetical protein [Candidatus Magasanikbacteria bacterium]